MTVTNGYITLTELRNAILPDNVPAISLADQRYERIIEAASRVIDHYCGRRFYGASETRYYTADNPDRLFIDDLTTVTTLQTDTGGDGTYETTWATTDYNLWPYNASADSKPYTAIETTAYGANDFPTSIRKGVKIVGVFGYVASTAAATGCPDEIHEACMIICNRYLMRKDTPLGISGNPTLGEQRVVIPRATLDPDVRDMLEPFRRLV